MRVGARSACVKLLDHFRGDRVVYTALDTGTSGYLEDEAARRNVLSGPDEHTLKLLGVTDWNAVLSCANRHLRE